LRREDLLGRYGGEEFLILLPGAAPYASLIVAERIRTAVNASLVPVGKHNIRFTVSVGVANSALGLGEKELLTDRVKRADDAMYKAKGFGRNRVEVST
jgi:diguanylate cyclase (GGDEF)-like protein